MKADIFQGHVKNKRLPSPYKTKKRTTFQRLPRFYHSRKCRFECNHLQYLNLWLLRYMFLLQLCIFLNLYHINTNFGFMLCRCLLSTLLHKNTVANRVISPGFSSHVLNWGITSRCLFWFRFEVIFCWFVLHVDDTKGYEEIFIFCTNN